VSKEHRCIWTRVEDNQLCLICGGSRPYRRRPDWWLIAACAAYGVLGIGWASYLIWRTFHG